jgi:APA family basic amino acid/polyamine antiporter
MHDTSRYPLSVAVNLVIANMIGTGIFTSLGYQVGSLPSGFSILVLWLLGGIVSLCGALVYAELATLFKQSGGEYLFLERIYHPLAGFLSGWVGFTAGFGGAIAAVAVATGEYIDGVTGVAPKSTAIVAIVIIAAIQLTGVRNGGLAQNVLTRFKIVLLVFFCAAPFFFPPAQPSGVTFLPSRADADLIFSAPFAVSLVFVMFAYSGWNAAAYITGQLENPSKTAPRALIYGTVTVMALYAGLNASFLISAPFSLLEGQNDIGNLVAERLFGHSSLWIFSVLFGLALLSSLNAMTIAGPRVLELAGKEYAGLRMLSRYNRFGVPWVATAVQAGWAMLLVLFSSFSEIIQYVAVTLTLSSMAVVLGLPLTRKKHSADAGVFRTPLYPLPVIVFTAVMGWMIWFSVTSNPVTLLYSALTLIPGVLLYYWAGRRNNADIKS